MSNFSCLLVCLLAVCCRLVTDVQSKQTIEVSSESLADYLCNEDFSIPSNTELVLSGQYILQAGQFCFNTASVTNIVIGSVTEEPAVIKCDGQRGFAFYNISGLTITNIIFEDCGGIIPDDTLKYSKELLFGTNQQAVLFLSHCSNITLANISITNYRGYAIIGSNILGESNFFNVSITESKFSSHTDVPLSTFEESGSGVLLYYYNSSAPGFAALSTITSNVLQITNSIFRDNTNVFPGARYFGLEEENKTILPDMIAGAGGITIRFQQQNFLTEILVQGTTIENNFGTLSGGAIVSYHNSLTPGFVKFDNCTFVNNSVPLFGRGAGIRIIILIDRKLLFSLSQEAIPIFQVHLVAIQDTKFVNNEAFRAAGIDIFESAHNITEVLITFTRVTFLGNKATNTGDCIQATSEPATFFSQKHLIIVLEDITINGTGTEYNGQEIITDHGLLNFDQIGYILINGTENNGCSFENSDTSVIYAFGTNVYLTGNMSFRGNTGLRGGAINLESGSRLLVIEPADVQFVNNHALEYGGAIGGYSVGGSQCAIQYAGRSNPDFFITEPEDLNELSINFTFVDNYSPVGRSIYLPQLYDCMWYPQSVVQLRNDDIIDVYRSLYHFPNIAGSENELEEIRSYPAKICICNTTTGLPECDRQNKEMSIYPGRSLFIFMGLVDASDQIVPGIMTTIIANKVPNLTIDNERIFRRDFFNTEQCAQLQYNLVGAENVTAQLNFHIATSPGLQVEVEILTCPPGFVLDDLSGECVCIPLYAELDFICNIEDLTIKRRNNQYWIGETTFLTPPAAAYAYRCPLEYCHLSTVNVATADPLCKGDRTGELCGKCRDGLSASFGTSHCRECSSYWLFTIPLYAIAGLLLVVILYVLKLTVALGTINGLFFYSHVINLTSSLYFEGTDLGLLRVFIALLDLELGFPLCFYHGMGSIGKVALQFVFPAYLWAIVVLIIFISRRSTIVSTLTSHISVQVLVTLLYLSLFKVISTILIILVPAQIITERSTIQVWFFDGSIRYFRGRYIILAILAIAFLFGFVIPYMFILSAYKRLIRYRRTTWLIPLIDAHFGPFKEKWRIYYVARFYLSAVITLIYVPLARGNPEGILIIQVILILLFLSVQAFIRPFKSDYINALDLFFMVNFCILAATTSYFHSLLSTGTAESQTLVRLYMNISVGFLIGSVFLIFWGIIGFHINLVFRPRVTRWLKKYKKGKTLPRRVHMTEVSLNDQQAGAGVVRVEGWEGFYYTSYRVRESILEDSSWQFPIPIPHKQQVTRSGIDI